MIDERLTLPSHPIPSHLITVDKKQETTQVPFDNLHDRFNLLSPSPMGKVQSQLEHEDPKLTLSILRNPIIVFRLLLFIFFVLVVHLGWALSRQF